MTQAANSYATGAGGPDFERRVATGFICSALAGTYFPPFANPPVKIWLQAAHLNCGFDDIVLDTGSSGTSQQRIFVSVKSAISPKTSDVEFTDVISKAWKDWNTRVSFDRSKDAFLLVAAISRSPHIHLLGKLTEIARASTDQTDFKNRLSIKGYNRSSIRDLHPEIAGVIKNETQSEPDSEDLRQFISHLFVSTFDFDQEASQDKSRVIGMLKLASESRDGHAAVSCWNTVFENVSLATPKAKTYTTVEFDSIARQCNLKIDTSVKIQTWLTNLRAHCRMARSCITSLLPNQHHIIRQKPLRDNLQEALSASQYVLVTGPAGSGKSALAIEAAENFAKPENVFCLQSEELAYPHLDVALQAAGLRDLNAEEWSDALPFEPRVLIIESLERLLQSTGSREAFRQLLCIVVTDRRWQVIVTCRDYLADHVRDTWNIPTRWNVVRVPLLETAELEATISGSGIPSLWLNQQVVLDALRNLKWLDLTMRAAQRITGLQTSTWATLSDWRDFVWRQLLNPELDLRGQELLVQIGIKRATSGLTWVTVDDTSLPVAEQLKKQGILSRNDTFPNRYRPEHDLLEDWALLFYVQREFADHAQQPVKLFAQLGDHLMVRRAFRQFFGELLESGKLTEGVAFIRRVFTDASCAKEWREEVANALLGSSCALDALHQTENFWTDESGEGLHLLCHLLRIAYRAKPQAETEPERPFGPGWNALMIFIHQRGDDFLRKHVRAVTSLLLDWHHAVTPSCPDPQGLAAAAELVEGLWQIATEGNDRFEKYWGNEDRHYMEASANRLCWLVSAVAGALDPKFFRDASREVFDEEREDRSTARTQRNRQSRELVEFLVADHAGWVLARAHPRTMVRLCLKAYGLRIKRGGARVGGYRRHGDCGLLADNHEFSPPSSLRGPFLELLQQHPKLGEAFILKLVNVATDRWAEAFQPDDMWEQPFEVTLNMSGKLVKQIADQGWWRCYRGWSPYPHVIECALMALEKWLLEDLSAQNLESLQQTLLRLIIKSNNVAVTAVAAAVGNVHWSRCGKLAAVLLECWPLLGLDRYRYVNDQTKNSFGGGWPKRDACYLKERQESDTLPHRQEQLEQFIIKAQLGPGQSEVWPVLDMLKAELAAMPPEQVTEEIQTARHILHRIDSRNLRIKRLVNKPDQFLVESVSPPPELQKHLEESEEKMQINLLPMDMQMWATQILEPSGSSQPQPQRWREMLEKALKFHLLPMEPARMFVFGDTPTLVAAVCLRDFILELNDNEFAWCVTQVTSTLHQQSDLTVWQGGSIMTAWRGERAAARACGILSATRPAKAGQMAAIDKATAIALSHPEKGVRIAAANGIGQLPSDSSIQLSACELLILHARLCRNVELRHRGPQCLPYENIQTWQDRCSKMHAEILIETHQLRERFIKGEAPDLRRLCLFYPRGQEEDQNLPAILATLLHHQSTTAKAVFCRARNWLAIQLTDENDRRHTHRKFAVDSWRDRDGRSSRSDLMNNGEAGRLLAQRVLTMSSPEVRLFYASVFQPRNICQLRDKAGVFLKDLCLMLDTGGNPSAFWTAWEVNVIAAIEVGSQLNNKEHWQRLNISPKAVTETFFALSSALFLNGMYFRPGQHWSPIDGQLKRFAEVFQDFQALGLNDYIPFLATVGGGLLPSAWRDISNCVLSLIHRSGKSYLTTTSQSHLMRLLAEEASLNRVPAGDNLTWNAIINLLDVLADAGFAEAFRVRENIARFATRVHCP